MNSLVVANSILDRSLLSMVISNHRTETRPIVGILFAGMTTLFLVSNPVETRAAIVYFPRIESLRFKSYEYGDFTPIQFEKLCIEWKMQSADLSSVTAMAMLPSYQRIIGMGSSALYLLIRQLELEGDQPDQWFWALKSITGNDPVKDEDRGNVKAMAKAWINWSKKQIVSVH